MSFNDSYEFFDRRMTPTSSGPNSFGKTKLGFVDTKKMYEKKMQEMLNDLGD